MGGKPSAQTVLRAVQAGHFSEQQRYFKCLPQPPAAMGSALRSDAPKSVGRFGPGGLTHPTGRYPASRHDRQLAGQRCNDKGRVRRWPMKLGGRASKDNTLSRGVPACSRSRIIE
jgi:hypothetical protein